MPEILIAACPPIGHVGPLLNVARGLVDRGDQVTFLTSERHSDKIRSVGAHPVALPAEADYDDSSFDADLPGRAETSGIKRINFDVTNIFVRPMPHQAAALEALLSEHRFDAIVADAVFFGVLPMLLADVPDRPPVLTYSTTPLFLTSCDTAPGGTGIAPAAGVVGRLRNRILNRLAQKVLLRPSQDAAQEMVAALGLPKLPVFVLDSAILGDRVISPTIEQFEYPRRDMPDHVRFVGAVNPTPASDFTPPEWWSELDGDRPVVHVTQGTIDNADLGKLVAPTIAALADEDVMVVVTTGGRDVTQLPGPIPANTYVAEYLPHDVLLPKVDVMITNGGYGAVQRALGTGVPLVVAGNTEDKPEVAARVAWAGVGVNLHSGTPAPSAIRRAVREVLADERYLAKARALQNEYAKHDSITAIAALVDEAIAERQPAVTR